MRLKASFSALAVIAFVASLQVDFDQLPEVFPQAVAEGAPTHAEPVRLADATLVRDGSPTAVCRSSTRLVETINYYDFFGTREKEADQSFRQRLLVSQDFNGKQKQFAGQADWHIDWQPCLEPRGGGCRLSGVTAIAYATYTLPRWADRRLAPEVLGGRWDRYADSLLAHERGHGVVALQIADLIERDLVGLTDMNSCTAVTEEATRRVDSLIRRGESMQNEYDRQTGHGNAQGAVFPF